MKILIVDDNTNDRTILRYMVRKNEHEAIEAEDGAAGLLTARQVRPDLIISDALMPVMDGFQFLREVKQDPSLRATPFIFYSSSYKGDQDVRLAMSLGADAYFTKPVEPLALWEQIAELLRKDAKPEPHPEPLIHEDAEYLKQYSQVVAAKLEEKVTELERTLEERKRAEEALRKSEMFIKNILENVDEGFIVLDRQFRILSANQAYVRNLKKEERQVVGRHCYEVCHRSEVPCPEKGELCAPQRVFSTGEPFRALHRHADNEGKQLFVETKAYPIRDENGDISSVIEIVVDITEKMKLEEQLRHAQKLEALGSLAGGVAHDFNNILNVVMGYGSMLSLKTQADDPRAPYIREIMAASERAAKLTKALLIFSRKQIADLKPVNLNDVVAGMQSMALRIIGEDIETGIDLSPEMLTVMGDYGQLEQVLMNFVTNARDAMPQGGTFTIRTELHEMDGEFVHMHGYGKAGRYARVVVSDTGCGMDEETRERIFEPFFTTKGVGKGTGLGLSIVYGIVKQHGGYIDCYSEKGSGTVFKVYLPLIESASLTTSVPEAEPMPGGTETILIAEDDPQILQLTKELLERFGYTAIEARDGVEAVSKFVEHRSTVRLLMLDIVMPKKSGRETYEEIRTLDPAVKVLFISGYTEEIIDRQSLIDERLPFIQKPAKPRELLLKIREVLDARDG